MSYYSCQRLGVDGFIESSIDIHLGFNYPYAMVSKQIVNIDKKSGLSKCMFIPKSIFHYRIYPLFTHHFDLAFTF